MFVEKSYEETSPRSRLQCNISLPIMKTGLVLSLSVMHGCTKALERERHQILKMKFLMDEF